MKKFEVTVNGTAYQVEVEEVGAPASAAAPVSSAVSAAPAAPFGAVQGTAVTCPMPGTIVDLRVKPGDTVTKGQVLVIFEAMKMENEILAAADGTVTAVHVNKGDSVEAGRVLLSIG